MQSNICIKKSKVRTPYINGEGNMDSHYNDYRYIITDDEGDILSNEYYYMDYLGNDHFAVCDFKDVKVNFGCNYYNIIKNNYELGYPKPKWGVICVSRDGNGNIIPKSETLVVPFVYDRITSGNLQCALARFSNKLTILELDKTSEFYARQLVPCVLDHLTPFCICYDNFAECSIDGHTGYLPRFIKSKEHLDKKWLLDDKEVCDINNYLKKEQDKLNPVTLAKYFYLTGVSIDNKSKVRKQKSRIKKLNI